MFLFLLFQALNYNKLLFEVYLQVCYNVIKLQKGVNFMTIPCPKTTSALMRYLRNQKGISISGSSQKRKLMNIGYYHGYKGYRYIRKPNNKIPFTDFNELLAIYEFDAKLKFLLYPFVMQIETALKNYVLETIVCTVKSSNFVEIYGTLLDNYKLYSTSGKTFANPKLRTQAEEKYKRELKRRLDLRNRIYKVQTDAFANNNKIAVHYLTKDTNLPIWAIFELLSLGEFGHFVSCLNFSCRQTISNTIGIKQSDDSNAMLPQRLIYATKDLRNAIAHNDVVFDTRFRTGNIDKQVCSTLTNATGVTDLNFETITDYFVLIVYQLTLIGVPKTNIRQLINSFIDCTEKLRQSIPINVYNQIIRTDNSSKIKALKHFI